MTQIALNNSKNRLAGNTSDGQPVVNHFDITLPSLVGLKDSPLATKSERKITTKSETKTLEITSPKNAGSHSTLSKDTLWDSRLVRIAATTALVGGYALWWVGEIIQDTVGPRTFPILSAYHGNFSHAAGFTALGWCISAVHGEQIANAVPFLKKPIDFLKKHPAEYAALATGTFFTLSETVLPLLVPVGQPSWYDVPSALLGCALSYLALSRPVDRWWNRRLNQ